jgi:hypothetical protein
VTPTSIAACNAPEQQPPQGVSIIGRTNWLTLPNPPARIGPAISTMPGRPSRLNPRPLGRGSGIKHALRWQRFSRLIPPLVRAERCWAVASRARAAVPPLIRWLRMPCTTTASFARLNSQERHDAFPRVRRFSRASSTMTAAGSHANIVAVAGGGLAGRVRTWSDATHDEAGGGTADGNPPRRG